MREDDAVEIEPEQPIEAPPGRPAISKDEPQEPAPAHVPVEPRRLQVQTGAEVRTGVEVLHQVRGDQRAARTVDEHRLVQNRPVDVHGDQHAAPVGVRGLSVLSSAGLVIYAFLQTGSSLFLVILALSLVGSGIAFCQSPVVRTTVSSVPKGMYGLASGLIETMRLVGMTISVAVAGIVFAVFSGNAYISPSLFPAFMQSFRFSFMIFLGISILCLGSILTLKRQEVTPGLTDPG